MPFWAAVKGQLHQDPASSSYQGDQACLERLEELVDLLQACWTGLMHLQHRACRAEAAVEACPLVLCLAFLACLVKVEGAVLLQQLLVVAA